MNESSPIKDALYAMIDEIGQEQIQNFPCSSIDYYNIEESRIDVTYLAESLSNIQSIQADNLPKKYLL